MISKSYEKKKGCFSEAAQWEEAGLTRGRTGWRFFMDKFSMTGWHLQSGKQALQSRTESEYKKEADIPSEYVSLDFILYFILSSPALHFRSFLLTCIFFSPSFFSCTAPPNIWLLAFYLSITPRLPHSRLLPKSFFRSLLLLIIFHSATPLSLCLSFFFIYFVLKATGCTLVVH